MPLHSNSHSLNSTNLRLGALTFVLSLAVLWTLSFSTSDPSLNLQIPKDPNPLPTQQPEDVSVLPTTPLSDPTPINFDATYPPAPTDQNPATGQDQATEPGGLPPPPELDNPPPAVPAPGDLAPDLLPPDQHPPSPYDPAISPNVGYEQNSPAPWDPPIPPNTDQPPFNPTEDPTLLNPISDPASAPIHTVDDLYNPLTEPTPQTTPSSSSSSPYNRPLILYVYSESPTARANLAFFVSQAIHPHADFIFIFNGNSTAHTLLPTPLPPNIQSITRPNTCYDLGALGEVLRADDLWRRYTRFITLNASIRGPFLPSWSRACWSDVYLSRVTATTKLVGMTLNCRPRPHVQSMIFATDDIGMAVLLDTEQADNRKVEEAGKEAEAGLVAFGGCYDGHAAAVHAEVGTTGLIRGAGYEVDVMMAAYQGERGPEEFCAANPQAGDVLFEGAYFGGNVHPYETVFIKANRNLDPGLLGRLTAWHMRMGRGAGETCGGV